ncbi:MAG: NUDIX domain-containing protein [Allosphingosinicella sp.]|uniref:NUDIX domain-containing protein n=1 Tax=Allosphingosinicella sp. TaxID=2823234 RepID=UPI00393D892F
MLQHSAGLLLFRRRDGETQVLLAHFGGPYWAKKDDGAWAIPKGLIEDGESPEQAARREFAEEVGPVPDGPLLPLGDILQKGGKLVTAFALEADFDPAQLASNSFTVEWPPRSGKMQSFPEVDRIAWFDLDQAHAKILPSQRPILDALSTLIAG